MQHEAPTPGQKHAPRTYPDNYRSRDLQLTQPWSDPGKDHSVALRRSDRITIAQGERDLIAIASSDCDQRSKSPMYIDNRSFLCRSVFNSCYKPTESSQRLRPCCTHLQFTRTKVRYTLILVTNNSDDRYRSIVIGQPRPTPHVTELRLSY